MDNRRKRRRRRSNKKGMLIITALLLVLMTVLLLHTNTLQKKNSVNAQTLAELEGQLESEQSRTEEIEDLSIYMQTKQFIEQEAKDKLGLVYKGQIIFKAEE